MDNYGWSSHPVKSQGGRIMSLQVEKLENNTAKLTIEVEASKFDKAIQKAYQKNKNKFNIPGFRKGKVPYAMVEKMYGAAVFYEDAANELISGAYAQAAEESGLEIVARPEINVTQIEKGKPFIFEAEVTTKPEVKLGKYKGIKVEKADVTVTDEEVTEELDKVKEQNARLVAADDKAVEDGDQTTIDFEGFVDGKSLDGGKGENYPLEIGSHTFIPGFEEGVVGMKSGETKELKLKFPDDYVVDLKGKEVTFNVTVREIKQRIIPELNEDFYQDLGYDNIKTEEEFLSEVEKVLLDRKSAEIEDEFVEKCLEKASNNMKVEINPEIIDDEVHRMIHQFDEQLKMQGIKLEDYMAITGITHDKLHEQMEPEATKRVKYRYLLEAIAKAEKIDFTEDEVKARSKEMADNYGISEEELLNAYGSLEVVKYDMKMHKAIEILKENN